MVFTVCPRKSFEKRTARRTPSASAKRAPSATGRRCARYHATSGSVSCLGGMTPGSRKCTHHSASVTAQGSAMTAARQASLEDAGSYTMPSTTTSHCTTNAAQTIAKMAKGGPREACHRFTMVCPPRV